MNRASRIQTTNSASRTNMDRIVGHYCHYRRVGRAAYFLPPNTLLVTRGDRHAETTSNRLGLAIHYYNQGRESFPPATICSYASDRAGQSIRCLGRGRQDGTQFFTEPAFWLVWFLIWEATIAPSLNRNAGVSSSLQARLTSLTNLELAMCDAIEFYCPSRREGLRPEDKTMMLSPDWTGGGTDYGGCAGRQDMPPSRSTSVITSATPRSTIPRVTTPAPFTAENDSMDKLWGIFGRVNISTIIDEISDGTSNTIMTGELQRITDVTPGSKDGLGDRRTGDVVHHRRDVQLRRRQIDLHRRSGRRAS